MSKNKNTNLFLDSALIQKTSISLINLEVARKIIHNHQFSKSKSTLFSRGKRTDSFFTEDSNLYAAPREQKLSKEGFVLDKSVRKWDSLSARVVRGYVERVPKRKDNKSFLYKKLLRRYERLGEELSAGSKNIIDKFSVVKLWNASIIAAIIFGMFTMTMIYKYLGQGASAGSVNDKSITQKESDSSPVLLTEAQVLGAEDSSDEDEIDNQDNVEYIEKVIQNLEKSEKRELEKEIKKMVKGYPIEKMVPYIVEKDKIVAAFIIGIAKKESNWGKRVPVLSGQDCYNYWGYRGKRRMMGTGGHTCFNSRKDAVDTIAKRLEWLVNNNKLNTPEKMIIWKCGSSCEGQSSYSVQKWISDVNMYFQKLND